MRRRSLKNSRKHESIELRNDYKTHFNYCELYQYLSEHIRVSWDCKPNVPLWKVPEHAMRIECNHIWSNHQRPDLWGNLICVGKPVHDWFHAHLQEGRIAAVFCKWKKGELSRADLNAACGKNALEWIQTFNVDGVFRDMQVELGGLI